jgi:hypothetical protein
LGLKFKEQFYFFMKSINRRKFIGVGCTTLAASLVTPESFTRVMGSGERTEEHTPIIHATDLYHLHNDPDDHYDLASIYALAYTGNIDLQGILIDYPSRPEHGDPDVMGVAQMNYYTGLVVPAIVGSPYLMKDRNDIQVKSSKIEHQGINWVINTLRKSPSPVVINIVGTATDIAVAAKKEPDLFKEKCKGIYLNAGSAFMGTGNKLEWNVFLNPNAYAAIFDASCPVYWLPCKNEKDAMEVGENGSYYKFLQNDILPYLPKKLQNFFLFMLGRKVSHKWFSYLNGEPEQELLTEFGSKYRNMWCTAGFLHAAGQKVTSAGKIVPVNSKENSVFSFKPMTVSCDDKGNTTWNPANHSENRYILHIDDVNNYQKAMTIALKNLLLQLPV